MQTQTEATVLTCLAEDCSYNCRDECCAPTIEVGADHPKCDTFTTGEVSIAEMMATVHDCKVGDCHFNDSMSCSAPGVTLSTHSGHADCMTYRH